MPRTGKGGGAPGPQTIGGYGALPMDQSVAPGGAYGSRQVAEAAVSAAPLPSATSAPAPNFDALEGAMRQMTPPTPLNAPSMRPDEPLTAGLPTGPGRNTVTTPTSPVTGILAGLAQATGSSALASLAAEAANSNL